MARGFCTCKRDHPGNMLCHPPEGASWHYLCDKPVLPPMPEPTPAVPPADPELPECWKLATMDGTAAEVMEQAHRALAEIGRAIAALDPPEYVPDDGEAERIAEVYADAKAELDRGL